MKAIETSYRGYRFRSRLEARWAVFFDALNLSWEYEPEGFDLGFGELYLPDFRVTSPQGLVTWYEVKPRHTLKDRKFQTFQESLLELSHGEDSTPAVFLAGDPVDVLCDGRAHVCPRCGQINLALLDTLDNYADDEVSVYCWPCDLNTPSGGGHPEEPGAIIASRPHKGFLVLEPYAWAQHKAIVQKAAIAARSARFEHGENGGVR